MKPVLWLPPSCAFILLLSGCAKDDPAIAGDPLGTGPFDRQGNYREDWVADPTKWTKPGKRHEAPDDIPVIASNDQPPANANPLAPQGTPKPVTNRVESMPRETAQRTESPKPVLVKPKPKPVVVKAKPKPKSTRYVVKSGDSLSAIASRTGSSVSAIKSANGISGTLIRPGQSLVIPKR